MTAMFGVLALVSEWMQTGRMLKLSGMVIETAMNRW